MTASPMHDPLTSSGDGPPEEAGDAGETSRSPSASTPPEGLDAGQLGLGDMDAVSFRAHGHAVIDWIADYLEHVGERPVLSQVRPGDVRSSLPASPPEDPEPLDASLRDLDEVLLPGITHWNHPAFHAYFSITGSGPGILGEAITAALNVNGMLWRTSPSATELEELVTDWVRQLLGLQTPFRGVICDTASMATLLALAAAREQTDLDIRQRGLAGRTDVPLLRVYTSEQAHSSVEKAVIALGLGRDGVRTIATDDAYRLDPEALAEAIREDVRFGHRPIAIVPTVGTTSTTSIDPVASILRVRDELQADLGIPIWVHVDAAYGGMLATCEEHRHAFDGVDGADSLVTNPHKWLFTPIDCSVLLLRDPSVLTRAFSLVPEYLVTDDEDVTDFMDWGVQLGRRFRALKLWMVIRYFGRRGIADRVRYHLALAQKVRAWVEAHPDLELVAPVPMSTVCFRARPRAAGPDEAADEEAARDRNRRWLAAVNRSGEAYLSHTELDGRYVLRLAIGNLRTDLTSLEGTLAVLERTLSELDLQ
jgi:aromatic-L-amino-acid/L-tryptophan decarboxylase